MENVEIQIDGKKSEWEHECWQNAKNQNLFVLINFTLDMRPMCCAIAKKHGYELQVKNRGEGHETCHFIPRNYHTPKMIMPNDLIFSGSAED